MRAIPAGGVVEAAPIAGGEAILPANHLSGDIQTAAGGERVLFLSAEGDTPPAMSLRTLAISSGEGGVIAANVSQFQVSPDGANVLFLSSASAYPYRPSSVAVAPVTGGRVTTLVSEASWAQWVGNKHIVSQRRPMSPAYSFQAGLYVSPVP